MHFEWDLEKEKENIKIHGVNFSKAREVFKDPKRIYIDDKKHHHKEKRFFCIGFDGDKILTVRFTLRGNSTRIFGAGYWRKTRKIYEKENQIHRR